MGGGAGGGGAAPHPFVPGSHLLMSNSQPAPTVPNIGTQTIGAPTSLGKFLYELFRYYFLMNFLDIIQ